MAQIHILAAENRISRSRHGNRQRLRFWMTVENLGYGKQVDVFWAGDDGQWRRLAAQFCCQHGSRQEIWQAKLTLAGRSGRALAGNVRFAACLQWSDHEYWDNHQGFNHDLPAGVGVKLFRNQKVQNLTLDPQLDDDQYFQGFELAIDRNFAPQRVDIIYSTDQWRSSSTLGCKPIRGSQQTASQLWAARLDISRLFALEYCVRVQIGEQVFWDNNGGRNYRLSHRPLSVLILNLHCYQEAEQQRKFRQIAKAIEEQHVDLVCFQEVAENWNHGHGDWASNSANIINQYLKRPMQLHWDWSHLGFDRYREGVAILSRYPLQHCQSRYVSDSHDPYSIHSRKVVAAQIDISHLGKLNLFSAHLSWWEDGFQGQFQRLSDWAAELRAEDVAATLLCGDFNIAAGSQGYRQVVEAGAYEDQYLAVNQQGLFEQIFRVNDPHWGAALADDYRIDYIFLNKNASIRAISARVIFTSQDYGTVSDHCGYLMQFVAG